MRYGSEIALGGVGGAAALGILIAALEMSIAAVPGPARGIDPLSVNRTLKGDRQPLPGAGRASSPVRTLHEPRLPEGCIGASDWRRAKIYTAEIAGRCIG